MFFCRSQRDSSKIVSTFSKKKNLMRRSYKRSTIFCVFWRCYCRKSKPSSHFVQHVELLSILKFPSCAVQIAKHIAYWCDSFTAFLLALKLYRTVSSIHPFTHNALLTRKLTTSFPNMILKKTGIYSSAGTSLNPFRNCGKIESALFYRNYALN